MEILKIEDKYVLSYELSPEGALDIKIIPTDPLVPQFWVDVPVVGEPSYTRMQQIHERSMEAVQNVVAVDPEVLPVDYSEQAQTAADNAAKEYKRQRKAELEAELASLRED